MPPRRKPARRPVVLVSGALVRATTLRLLGWDRTAIEAALGQRVDPTEVVAVEDARSGRGQRPGS